MGINEWPGCYISRRYILDGGQLPGFYIFTFSFASNPDKRNEQNKHETWHTRRIGLHGQAGRSMKERYAVSPVSNRVGWLS